MNANLGSVDRIIRLILGLSLIAAGVVAGYQEPWNWVALGVGAVMAITASIKFCPAYALIGVNTCGCNNEQAGDK
ncbi:MAG: DUF2892 domain-containing protein [Mariprofundales bacterium]